MSEQTEVPFPAAPEPVDEQRRGKELDARLKLLTELSRIASHRAVMHANLSLQHQGRWLEGWELEKSQRLHALARVLASDEFAGLVRGTTELRRLFSRDMPAIPPKRTGPDFRHKRKKPKSGEPWVVLDPGTWTWPKT